MSREKRSSGQRGKRGRRSRATPEEQAKRRERTRLYLHNQKKLTEFLAGEPRESWRKVSPVLSWLGAIAAQQQPAPTEYIVPAERYADPVIETFHARTVVGKALHSPDFDPKAEYDNFITSYAGRFGEAKPKPHNAAKKSRKGIGGRHEGEFTEEIRRLVNEDGATDVEEIARLTYSFSYRGRVADPEGKPLNWKRHLKKVKERLGRIAPHLLPPKTNRPRKKDRS